MQIAFGCVHPQNLASERVYSRNCCSLKCKHIFGLYYNTPKIQRIFMVYLHVRLNAPTSKLHPRYELQLKREFDISTHAHSE